MSKQAFASLILKKLSSSVGNDGTVYTDGTSETAQEAIASAITEYLTANTTVSISYSGVLTSGSPDPVATDTLKITGACKSTGTPTDFSSWIKAMQSCISSGFSTLSPGSGGVTTTFQPFSSVSGALSIEQSLLQSAHQDNMDNPAQVVWESVCGGIMDWINSSSAKNPSANGIPATRPSSSGTASLVSLAVI